MKVALAQTKPKLCLTEEAFVDVIDEIVGDIVREEKPDLIVFPESLGLWLCMMNSKSWWKKLVSKFLPSHRVKASWLRWALNTHWGDFKGGDPDVQEQTISTLQFSRGYKPKGVLAASNGRLTSLASVPEYSSELLPGSKTVNVGNWFLRKVEGVAQWFFKSVRLEWVAMKMRSQEQKDAYFKAFSKAAHKYGVTIQAGTIFEAREDGVYNVAHTFSCQGFFEVQEGGTHVSQIFSRGGFLLASQEKIHPIPFENFIGVEPGSGLTTFLVPGERGGELELTKVGVAICADVNFPDDVVSDLVRMGVKFICCPSGGLVPSHAWQWNFNREIGIANLARSLEENVIIGRVYNAGDLIPNALMFQGRSAITGPQHLGEPADEIHKGVLAIVPMKNMTKADTIRFEVPDYDTGRVVSDWRKPILT